MWKTWNKKILLSTDDTGGGASGGGTDSNTADDTKTDVEKVPPAEDGKKPEEQQETTSGKYTDEDITKLNEGFEQRLKAETEKAVEEALKKAQMKPEDKEKYEQEQRLAEIARREKEADSKELRLDTMGMLASKQLDRDFIDYVIGADKASTAKRIDTFKAIFDKAVQAQVELRLTGKSPSAGSSATAADSIRSQFKDAMGGY